MRQLFVTITLACCLQWAVAARAQAPGAQGAQLYQIQPGDTLEISVWREPDLDREVLVRPDGRFSFPLVGDIDATGKSVDSLRQEIVSALTRFIPDLVVTVSVEDIQGNKVFVLGQVRSPGEFVVNPSIDVMQALAIAGGTTEFAKLDEIIVLRRNRDGAQRAIGFNYSDVVRGRNLEQNLMLSSGDIVVVP